MVVTVSFYMYSIPLNCTLEMVRKTVFYMTCTYQEKKKSIAVHKEGTQSFQKPTTEIPNALEDPEMLTSK